MADENDKVGAPGTRRFRLPKLFAESDEAAEGLAEDGGIDDLDVIQSQNARDSSVPRSSLASLTSATTSTVAGLDVMQDAPSGLASRGAEASAAESTTSEEILEFVAGMAQELLALREKISGVAEAVDEMSARETSQEKVFDALHAELGDYKKDFIYEHLKPVVRPLLFLYDSLEQFDGEVAQFERPDPEERRQGLAPKLVRENMAFFREQLVEALRVCEVTLMDPPEGTFNPKTQKAIGVEKVEPDRDNTVVRVVRTGWYLNGQLLRPVEVIVGRAGR